MALRLAVAGEPAGYITRVVSGPSPQLAMLRALAVKAATHAQRAWAWIRTGAHAVVHAPGWIAQAVLSGLSTSAGYASAVGLVAGAVKVVHKVVDKTARAVGRASMLASYTAAGFLPGALAEKATTWIDHSSTTVASGYTQQRARVEALGQHLLHLAHSPLVRTVATRSAATASALIAVHFITKGVVATRLVQAMPALAGATVLVTSPWWALAGVGAVTTTALLWAAIRVARSSRSQDATAGTVADPQDTAQGNPSGHTTATPHDITPADLDGLTVDIGIDGSVLVHGIPADLPEEAQERLAHAAVARMAAGGPARPGNRSAGAARRRRR